MKLILKDVRNNFFKNKDVRNTIAWNDLEILDLFSFLINTRVSPDLGKKLLKVIRKEQEKLYSHEWGATYDE